MFRAGGILEMPFGEVKRIFEAALHCYDLREAQWTVMDGVEGHSAEKATVVEYYAENGDSFDRYYFQLF